VVRALDRVAPSSQSTGDMSFARRRLHAALSFALLVCLSASANADEGVTPPARTSWYGYQTLIADGASLALVTVGGTFAPSPGARSAFGFAGVGSYLLAPFVIHAAHGQAGRGAGSFALRALAPVGGALVGLAVSAMYLSVTDDPDNGLATAIRAGTIAGLGMYIGAGVGAVAAVTVDSAVLAREAERKEPIQAVRSKPMTVRPVIGMTGNGGASAGIAGTF
jgi:hypothetical protein